MQKPEDAHLVLVEDEASIMTVNLWWIKDMGWANIHGVPSVAGLLDYLGTSLRQGRPVDLILMDIVMPGINGIEGCQRVRSQQTFADIPIIMLTSMQDKDILESAFAAGANDYVLKPFNETELRARMRSALRLKEETDRRKQREQELLKLSQALIARQLHAEEALFQDALTGIYNRRAFDKKLEDEWLNCYVAHRPLALIMLDIDYFKQCNDKYGHQVGDRCLASVARVLSDSASGLFAARYGGEEFVVLLPGASQHEAELQAEKIRQRIESAALELPELSRPLQVTASLGVACVMPGDEPHPSVLISNADAALYRAKQRGRNCVAV